MTDNDGGSGCPQGGTLDCREVFLRLDDYVDRALSEAEIERVRAHLDACSPCAEELGFSESMIHEIKSKLRRIRCPAALRSRIAEMLAPDR